MPQHHARYRHLTIRERPADAYVLSGHEERGVEEGVAPARIDENIVHPIKVFICAARRSHLS
jgi:hypothetical protein